jgi:uncharacterized protein
MYDINNQTNIGVFISHILLYRYVGLFVLSATFFAPIASQAASFDCNGKKNILEMFICSNDDLSSLDGQVGDDYSKLRNSFSKGSSQQQDALGEQRQFLKQRLEVCPITMQANYSDADSNRIITCLKRLYTLRQLEIQKQLAIAPQPAPEQIEPTSVVTATPIIVETPQQNQPPVTDTTSNTNEENTPKNRLTQSTPFRNYIATIYGSQVVKTDSKGSILMRINLADYGLDKFSVIAVDNNENTWVTDFRKCRILKFDSNGKYLMQFGSAGDSDSQFKEIWGIAVDSKNNVWVLDRGNSRHSGMGIKIFDQSGNYLKKMGTYLNDKDSSYLNGRFDWLGGFNSLSAIAIDHNDNVWLTETSYNRVWKFDSSGKFILRIGGHEINESHINNPEGITLDKNDNLYVNNNRGVDKFDTNGQFLSHLNIHIGDESHFAIDEHDNIWEKGVHSITIYDNTGKKIHEEVSGYSSSDITSHLYHAISNKPTPDHPTTENNQNTKISIYNLKFNNDPTLPLHELKDLAGQGYLDAQTYLGLAYQHAAIEPYDPTEGAKWLQMAADNGYPAAQTGLGNAYHSGLGVKKSESYAIKWWSKAAEQGDSEAKEQLPQETSSQETERILAIAALPVKSSYYTYTPSIPNTTYHVQCGNMEHLIHNARNYTSQKVPLQKILIRLINESTFGSDAWINKKLRDFIESSIRNEYNNPEEYYSYLLSHKWIDDCVAYIK